MEGIFSPVFIMCGIRVKVDRRKDGMGYRGV